MMIMMMMIMMMMMVVMMMIMMMIIRHMHGASQGDVLSFDDVVLFHDVCFVFDDAERGILTLCTYYVLI